MWRLIPGILKASRIFLRNLWRVARQVSHEVAGAMFGFFALYGLLGAWRVVQRRQVLWLLAFWIVYALVMAAFAAVSFRSARRVR